MANYTSFLAKPVKNGRISLRDVEYFPPRQFLVATVGP